MFHKSTKQSISNCGWESARPFRPVGVLSSARAQRFRAAASAPGGGWVSYAWRNTADEVLRMKGAYIIALRKVLSTFPLLVRSHC